MTDERLDQALSSLPRERASDDFTARVMQRAAQSTTGTAQTVTGPPESRRTQSAALPWSRSWTWAAAASLAVLLLAGVLWRTSNRALPNTIASPATAATSPAEKDAARALLAELKAEHRQLTNALRQRQQEPVLYLGGDEGLDVVLDLGRTDLMPANGEYRPASHPVTGPRRTF